MHSFTITTALLLLITLAAAAACDTRNEDTPLIFAAASLSDVLIDVQKLYEQESGSSVAFNFGGSIAMANQIARLNSPADGVIMAGQAPMDILIEAGMVNAANVTPLASNFLVVMAEGDAQLASLADIADDESIIAIADPDLAPAGQYAREALQTAGIWEEIQDKVVPTLDVRAALAALGNGSVDFAIVYATDALTEPELNVVLSIDSALHQPVSYPAAPVTDAPGADAAGLFFEFLEWPDAKQVFDQYGFTKD